MEQKRRLFAFREEENSLARSMDARPCLAPRLAATPPSGLPPGVSAHDRTRRQARVKKWRKRLTEDDPDDPSVWCARSRAHHASYLRWDGRVIQRIVEMRFSPPENADRVCLGLVPCSTSFLVTRRGLAAHVPLPRSSRTKWRELAHHGLPGDSFQRAALPH